MEAETDAEAVGVEIEAETVDGIGASTSPVYNATTNFHSFIWNAMLVSFQTCSKRFRKPLLNTQRSFFSRDIARRYIRSPPIAFEGGGIEEECRENLETYCCC